MFENNGYEKNKAIKDEFFSTTLLQKMILTYSLAGVVIENDESATSASKKGNRPGVAPMNRLFVDILDTYDKEYNVQADKDALEEYGIDKLSQITISHKPTTSYRDILMLHDEKYLKHLTSKLLDDEDHFTCKQEYVDYLYNKVCTYDFVKSSFLNMNIPQAMEFLRILIQPDEVEPWEIVLTGDIPVDFNLITCFQNNGVYSLVIPNEIKSELVTLFAGNDSLHIAHLQAIIEYCYSALLLYGVISLDEMVATILHYESEFMEGIPLKDIIIESTNSFHGFIYKDNWLASLSLENNTDIADDILKSQQNQTRYLPKAQDLLGFSPIEYDDESYDRWFAYGHPQDDEVTKGKALQLKIVLKGFSPPVWRRIVIPPDFTLKSLSSVIHDIYGWEGMHLHGFFIKKYNILIEDTDEEYIRADIFAGRVKTFQFEYDFGDSWIHDIQIEKQIDDYEDAYPKVLKFKGPNHIEDCYVDEESGDDDDWGIKEFDIDAVNTALREKIYTPWNGNNLDSISTNKMILDELDMFQAYEEIDKNLKKFNKTIKTEAAKTRIKDGRDNKGISRDLYLDYANAAVNLYGVISIDDMKKLIVEFEGEDENIDKLEKYIEDDPNFDGEIMGYYLVNMDLAEVFEYDNSPKDYQDFVDFITKQHKIISRYLPEKDLFLKYKNPYFYETGDEHASLLAVAKSSLTHTIESEIFEKDDIYDDLIYDIFFAIQMYLPMPLVISIIGEYGFAFRDSGSKEQFSNALIAFRNSARLWICNGQTPTEAGYTEFPGMPAQRAKDKIGRNDPCPCGSGKKYKKCCMLKDN